MADVITISTIDEALAWGDEWHRIARDLARELYMVEMELAYQRSLADTYRAGYAIAMNLAKPAPKFEPETV